MKSGKKIVTLILFLFAALLYNCSDIVTPDEVDPQLIGEWYYTVDNNSSYPSPRIYFFGIQITPDKNVKQLGIETNTGKVAVKNDHEKKIIFANDGNLIWEVFYEGLGKVNEKYTYKIENGELILSNQNNIYKRTRLGTQLYEPITSNFSVKRDTISYENLKISPYPSAFISKRSTSEIFLEVSMKNAFLNIEINDFTGAGNYEIKIDKFAFHEFYSDVGIVYLSDTLSAGNITITQFDELNNICSGEFYLNAIGGNNPDSIITLFKEGKFTVPIYK